MRNDQTPSESAASRAGARGPDDDQTRQEILAFIRDNPDAGEWEIARAIGVPIKLVYVLTRELEAHDEPTREEE